MNDIDMTMTVNGERWRGVAAVVLVVIVFQRPPLQYQRRARYYHPLYTLAWQQQHSSHCRRGRPALLASSSLSLPHPRRSSSRSTLLCLLGSIYRHSCDMHTLCCHSRSSSTHRRPCQMTKVKTTCYTRSPPCKGSIILFIGGIDWFFAGAHIEEERDEE